ncbi:hypothetical protein MVEN_00072700 [Mycena venus]|uniref:Uncharacterized protein n=1 Tax=Mycena venus TaxID=2733690 RepID=A0A8H6Z3X8_9AGAR|nr:hypothetical protein MVEN_00072700 [Mycena venus]
MPAAPAPTPMLARGDRNAPQFDSTKPHELRRYFTDLEFLLGRAAVTDNAEMKKRATRFLSVEDQEIWEGLPSFKDAQKSFSDFKAAVLKLYSGNDEDHRFGLNDLDALVGQYSRVGILSLDDLKTFYRQFLRNATYLIGKKRLSEGEQSRSFLCAMQPSTLAADIRLHLKVNHPKAHPADPLPVADLYEAAEYALAGFGSSLALDVHTAPSISSTSSAPVSTPTTIEVKPNPGIAALVGTMAKLIEVLAMQKPSETSKENSQKKMGPDGSQLLVEVAVNHSPLPSSSPSTGIYTLTEEQPLQVLQHEINALQTRAQARKALEKRSNDSADRTIPPPPPHHPTPPAAAAPATLVVPTKPTAQPVSQGSLHPFANARDAAYAPPKQQNLGAPATSQSKPAPAYCSTAPIYNEKDAADIVNAVLDAPCQLTTRQVLSISPDVRSHVREATTSRRAPAKDSNNPGAPAAQLLHDVDFPLPFSHGSDPAYETLDEQWDKDALYSAFIDSLPATYISSEKANFKLPDGGVVVPNPYAVYYESEAVPNYLIGELAPRFYQGIVKGSNLRMMGSMSEGIFMRTER